MADRDYGDLTERVEQVAIRMLAADLVLDPEHVEEWWLDQPETECDHWRHLAHLAIQAIDTGSGDPTPAEIDAFRTAWTDADSRGDAGNRVKAGLTTAYAIRDKKLGDLG